MATDPICGMYVDERTADLTFFRENRTYYFCSSACREQFAEPTARQAALQRELAVAWPLGILVLVATYLPGVPAAPWVALGAAAVVQFGPGRTFYRGAWDALRNRVGNMDLLIASATTAAFAYSAAVVLVPGRLPPAFYFDASALIIALILTGNYLEAVTRARASGALRSLQAIVPTMARAVRAGQEVSIPVSEVAPGEVLAVRPGERFPADGTLRSGATSAEESFLTGESMPVPKRGGDRVLAGALNLDGAVTVVATGVGSDTLVAQVGALLGEAEMSRVPLRALADRIASVFVPFVLGAALAASLGWYLFGGAGASVALLIFVSVAITACPCAFGIATPAAIIVGTGRAAESGALFKGRDALERAAGIDTVVFDKTGTLTLGRPSLAEFRPVPGLAPEPLLAEFAAVESGSEHPLARAVQSAAAARSLPRVEVSDIRALPGIGVEGRSGTQRIRVVTGAAARAGGADLRALEPAIVEMEARGLTWSVGLEDDRSVAVLGFDDPVRPTSAHAVAELARSGRSVVLLTGDNPSAARRVAEQLGIREVHAGATPGDKVRLIEQLRAAGHKVAFVGDGINDAPALAAADAGLAIGVGSDVAREAGQILLVGSDPAAVPVALEIARATVHKVRQNLIWALGYNSILLPIAAGALVPFLGFGVYEVLPITGGLAMGLSSTSVVLNSYSLRRAGGRRPARPA